MASAAVQAVEQYLQALRDKDVSKAPLADDVRFEDPLTEPLAGREAVVGFIERFLPALNGIEVRRHVAEGEYVATMWQAETVFGVVPIFECFRVVDGQIVEAQAFLDPRPFLSAAP